MFQNLFPLKSLVTIFCALVLFDYACDMDHESTENT